MGPWRTSVMLVVILLTVVAVAAAGSLAAIEGMQEEGAGGLLIGVNPECPNVIMESGGQIHLYNTRKAKVPGVNPITLSSLTDYPQLMAFLNAKGMNCPALFLRQGRNAMGEIEMEQLVVSPGGEMVPLWRRTGLGPRH
jgi:hypothetical protein